MIEKITHLLADGKINISDMLNKSRATSPTTSSMWTAT
jgi:glycine cleavage system regulatory protein